MSEKPERFRDDQGHEWPVTGYWCDACGMPLHRTLRAVGVHPTCEVQQAGHGNEGGSDGGYAPDTATLATLTPPSPPEVPSDDVNEGPHPLDSCAPSVKRLRVQIITDVAANPDSLAKDVAKRLGEPRKRVNDQLRALTSLGLLTPDKPDAVMGRNIALLRYALAEGAIQPKGSPLFVPGPAAVRQGDLLFQTSEGGNPQ